MSPDTETMQDPGIAKIRALLLAARTRIVAESEELTKSSMAPLKTGDAVTDQSAKLEHIRKLYEKLRADVEAVRVSGTDAISARDLAAQTLLETDQSLAALAKSYSADHAGSLTLVAESVKLSKAAQATSLKAGKALGIPWPLL
jgi:hypothetical protein